MNNHGSINELRLDPQYNNLFIKNHSIMMIVNPATGDIVDANLAACQFYGYRYSDLLNMNISQINTLTPEEIFKEMQKAKEENRKQFFFEHRLSNGMIRNVEVYSGPINVGNNQYLYSIIHDITKRKQAEKELLLLNKALDKKVIERTVQLEEVNAVLEEVNASLEEEISERIKFEELLQESMVEIEDLYENAPCGYHSLDVNGYITRINQTELDWLGYEKEEIIGKKKFIEIITSEGREVFKQNYPAFIKRGWVKDLEFTLIHKDGSLRPVLVSATAIKDKNGQYLMSRSTLYDISKIKLAERELQLLNSDLEEKVAERTHELQKANLRLQETNTILEETNAELEEMNAILEEEISERMKAEEAMSHAEAASDAKSLFLANMSHEIRTPINAIIGFNYLMQKTTLSDTQRDYVEKTMLSAKSLLGLVNDILDFSKIEANKIVLEEETFDVFEQINNVCSIVSFDLYEKNLKLHIDVDPDIPQYLKGDLLRLNQVLLNLLNNAIKFTEQGDIRLSLDLENKEHQKVVLRYTVSDTGIGMSVDQQKKLFDAFSQVDMSTTRKHGGTGLGLSISKSLIELMGGTIHVKSELGRGSSFAFTAQFKWLMNQREELDVTPKFSKILLVCDDDKRASAINRELEQFDMVLECVKSLPLSMQTLQSNTFDLLLIDKELLGESIRESVIKIKDLIKERYAFMVVTADRQKEFEALSYEDYVKGILYFPIGKSQIYNKLVRTKEKDLNNKEVSNSYLGNKVLLVEDNEINQELAKAILEEFGFDIDIADNGKVALERVLKETYDLILMDLQMPVMDGYEASKRIREISSYKETIIIAMSAHALKGIEEKVYKAGMNDYITKPFEVSKMLETLRKWTNINKRFGRT